MATRSREKAAARRENADKRPRATAKYVRIAPRKVKIVVDLIRRHIFQVQGINNLLLDVVDQFFHSMII